MVIIGAATFRKEQKYYFDMAQKEQVIIKRGQQYIELMVRSTLPKAIRSDILRHVIRR